MADHKFYYWHLAIDTAAVADYKFCYWRLSQWHYYKFYYRHLQYITSSILAITADKSFSRSLTAFVNANDINFTRAKLIFVRNISRSIQRKLGHESKSLYSYSDTDRQSKLLLLVSTGLKRVSFHNACRFFTLHVSPRRENALHTQSLIGSFSLLMLYKNKLESTISIESHYRVSLSSCALQYTRSSS